MSKDVNTLLYQIYVLVEAACVCRTVSVERVVTHRSYRPVLRNCAPPSCNLSAMAVKKAMLNGERNGSLKASAVKAAMARWLVKTGLGVIGKRCGRPYVYFPKFSYSTFCTNVYAIECAISHFVCA